MPPLRHGVPLLTVRRGADTLGMAAPIYWTAEMVRQLPDDGNRYEVVYGGLLVTPAPRLNHQLLVSRLAVAVAKYLEHEPVGVMLTSPADISWGQDVLVQPDVFVVPLDEARTGDWSKLSSLLVAAEVLDRFTKRRRYQEARVPLYWVSRWCGPARRGVDAGCRVPCDRTGAARVASGGRRPALHFRAGRLVSTESEWLFQLHPSHAATPRSIRCVVIMVARSFTAESAARC